MADRLEYKVESRPTRVRDIPERLRPREEMARLGVRNVSDETLLAVILRSGTRGVNVVDLSRRLLRAYESLTAIATASVDDLSRNPGVGRVKAQVLAAALELGSRLAEETAPRRVRIRTPEEAAGVVRLKLKTLATETFWVLMLDAKNYLKGPPEEVTRGVLDASLVHAREVFRTAIRRSCAAIVLVHNHPSGDPSPSTEDIRITRQMIQAGKVVDIRVLDHIILGQRSEDNVCDFISLRENGLVEF